MIDTIQKHQSARRPFGDAATTPIIGLDIFNVAYVCAAAIGLSYSEPCVGVIMSDWTFCRVAELLSWLGCGFVVRR